jgi:hypothetical protein
MEQTVPDSVFTSDEHEPEERDRANIEPPADRQSADAYNAWLTESVRIGIESANAGNLISNDVVEAEFAARRAAAFSKFGTKPK